MGWRQLCLFILVMISIQNVDGEECSLSLGASHGGDLPDSAFTASSSFRDYTADKARLGNFKTAWIPKDYSPKVKGRRSYLQVDLGQVKKITSVKLQGFEGSSPQYYFYVTYLYLVFSKDGIVFDYYRYGKPTDSVIFRGNSDHRTIANVKLHCPVYARYIRFEPLNFINGIALNVDVLGCTPETRNSTSVTDLQLNFVKRKVQIVWTQVKPNVQLFHLHIPGFVSGKFIQAKTGQTLPVKYMEELDSLSPCKTVFFILRVYDDSKCGVPEVMKHKYKTPPKPLEPQNIKVDTSTPLTIKLSWEKPPLSPECPNSEHSLTGYKIVYKKTSSPSDFNQVKVSSTDLQHTITNLESWTKYDVQIIAMNDLYQSDLALVKDIDVSGKPPEAAPEINLLVSESPRTILLQWKNPDAEKINGVITGYKVHYRVRGKEEWLSLDVLKGDDDHHSMKIIGEKDQPLLPWKYYEVYVTLYNQKYNISSVIKDVLVTGSGPGAAPENVQASKITEKGCVLEWDDIPDSLLPTKETFLGYKIFYNAENDNQRSYSPDNIAETRIEIENLKPATRYFFSIAGVTENKVGPLSTKVSITTFAGPLPPPVILTHESRKANEFSLQWKLDPGVPIVTSLVLQYKRKEHIDTWTTLDVIGRTNITIPNLLAWQQYDAKLNLESDGRKSSSTLSPVLVKGKVPGQSPTNLHVIDFKYKYITLSWDTIDPRWVFGKLIDYVIMYGVKENGDTVDVNYTKDTNITIENLIPGTEYNFQVAGRTKDGEGVFSETLTRSTKKLADPGIPQNAVAHNISPTKVKIRCSVMGDISIFVVKLKNLATGLSKDVEYHISTVTVVKVSNHEYSLVVTVEAFTEYQIQLKSCIFDKCSSFSKMMLIRTNEDAPSEVRELKIIESDVNDTVVTWKQPKHVPGIIRYYKLNVMYLSGVVVENFPVKLDNNTFKITLRDLPPFSVLQLAIHAVTVKPGPMIETKFKSPHGLPSEPRNIIVIPFRKYGMSLKWVEPEFPNGFILGYKIKYEGKKYYREDFRVNDSFVVAANYLQPYRIHNLVPGTTYKVSIAARTIKGYGPFGQAKKEILTAVKKPKAPKVPIPDSDSRSSSTVTVYLRRAVQEYGPIKWYQLIIEEKDPSSKKRRSVDVIPNEINGYSVAKEKGERFYITAVVSNQRVPGKFVLGNDKDYNHYRNHPLKPETNYDLHVRAVTEDNKRQYYGDVASISLPTTLAVKKEWNESSILIPVIVGVAGGILMIILCVVIFVRCKRNARSKKEADDFDQSFYKIKATPEEVEEMLPKQQNIYDTYPINPNYPPISAAQFAKHVAKLHRNNNSGFKAEYADLRIGKEFPWDVAHLMENKPKNRYDNIVAYDHSRVKLSLIYDVPGSDYINASYIDGYRKPNGYVPTQGPLPSTYNDFWRMVWELKSTCIVMLTNLQEKNKLKCHKYWPDDSTDYGDIKVSLLRYDPYADFTIRTFQLEDVSNYKPGEAANFQVRQFHFTSWPDHGVPQYPTSLLNFRRKVRSYDEPQTGPVIVHCSAGVGRTGAYIAIDSMLERVHYQNDVDVFNFIANMRMRRIAMVQTEDQYVFVHDSIVDSIMNGNTEVTSHGLREAIRALDQIDPLSKVSGFEMQWKTLNHTNVTLHKSDYVVGLQGDNAEKNRYSTVLPTESSRVLLLPIDEIESSTYINAVYVDSYKQKNAFILTQSPLPQTVIDFWRMVSEHGISSIVMLNAIDEGEDYGKYWPDSGRQDYGMITVECIPDAVVDDIDITSNMYLKPIYRTTPTELVVRCFQITDKRNPSKSITARLFHYIGWTETRVPNTYRPVISLLSQIERWQQQSGRGPITIMCSDGIGRSGTLAAIIYVLERVKLTQVFDAFQSIKAMRIQRQHAVKYMDQFKYIHYAVQEYLSAFEEHTKL